MSVARTFSIFTLGCKVNQYETEQLAAMLRSRGLRQADPGEQADLRIVNTCSVTSEAAAKSRQAVRRATATKVLGLTVRGKSIDSGKSISNRRPRVLVTGCWATSNKSDALNLGGVDAVLTHHDDVAAELESFLRQSFGTRLGCDDDHIPAAERRAAEKRNVGTTSLPLLDDRQSLHQRAFLKIQDGCDAHCTYCIIPQLRPALWSKPVEDAVEEARRMVAAGHREIVLTGIFLGAFGQQTALRRRQDRETAEPLGELIDALCTRVPGLLRVRLSAMEPGDLTPRLIATLRSHPQVVPHFHLPLQSGSDPILRRMNRQYTRDQFLEMIDQVRAAFDRPAITTDIIVGFPGETDEQFTRTLEVVAAAKFIHIHAFPFSPRPGTAAARWGDNFVPSGVVAARMDELKRRAVEHSFAFRQQFIGEEVQVLVERPAPSQPPTVHRGRCPRYFDVHFEADPSGPDAAALCGRIARARIGTVTPTRTHGTLLSIS